jgi:hypothetical protein
MNPNPVIVLKLAALAHIGLLVAGQMMPFVTGLWAELRKLAPFPRRLFCVYYAFVILCVVAFGLGSWFFAGDLASGTTPTRWICAFLTVFWLIRLVAALWIFDVRPYLTNNWLRLGHHVTNVVFAMMPMVYAWLALR